MNYYPFHLGDYSAHTAHLDPIEDIAYRRLLDLYYLREAPLSFADDLARLIRMRGHEEVVARILNEFFEEDGETWIHPRCDEEIARYQAMVSGGRKGAGMRWQKARDPQPIGGASPGDALPIDPPMPTKNQEPRTKNQKKREGAQSRATPPERPAEVDEQTWTDWLALRRQKRAPVTATVLEGARRESEKAGMGLGDFLAVWCTRGSQGLQAEWLRPEERVFRRPAAESFRERDERAARERWEAMTGRRWPGAPAEVIEITPPRLQGGDR